MTLNAPPGRMSCEISELHSQKMNIQFSSALSFYEQEAPQLLKSNCIAQSAFKYTVSPVSELVFPREI